MRGYSECGIMLRGSTKQIAWSGSRVDGCERITMSGFLELLKEQRWDDHRYYHHSRINQSLHLLSAISFVCAYVLGSRIRRSAALMGWLVAMTSRQTGHFFLRAQGLRRRQPGDP